MEYYKIKITEALKTLKPLQIILFGSVARNYIYEDSDFDFLVVLDDNKVPETYDDKIKLKLKVRNRLGELSKKVPIDLIVYTKPEFEELKRLNNSFYREIEKSGLIMYEKAS